MKCIEVLKERDKAILRDAIWSSIACAAFLVLSVVCYFTCGGVAWGFMAYIAGMILLGLNSFYGHMRANLRAQMVAMKVLKDNQKHMAELMGLMWVDEEDDYLGD